MAKGKYPRLFEPISIGKVEIKNRIAMAPMAIGGLTTPDGGFSPRAIDYYVERAKGGRRGPEHHARHLGRFRSRPEYLN